MQRFTVTTPIYYATEQPHVGHTFTTLLADVLARAAVQFEGGVLVRADLDAATVQEDGSVFFLTGTDEHGTKVATKAQVAGQEPKVFVDAIRKDYEAAWELLGIEPSAFIQTTNPRHEAFVQGIAQGMLDRGDIYKGTFTGLYCPDCEGFKTRTELTEDGLCPDHKKAPQAVEEENYFFKLSAYQDWLIETLESDTLLLKPANRKSEVLAFLKGQKLQDLSISRKKSSVAWGVGLPFDEEHTMYVWIDALFNYVSSLAILGGEYQARFWPADLHLMAKEITRFHAVYWPAFLKSAGLPLPTTIVAHGWFTVEGQKMSKTLGNVLRPTDLFPRFGRDPLRYLLATSMRLDSDGDLSMERLSARYNAELANGLGNLVNRVVTLAAKYLDGPIELALAKDPSGEWGTWRAATLKAYREDYDVLAAAEAAMRFVEFGNKYADETKVWALAKEDSAKFREVITTLGHAADTALELLTPLMPELCAKGREAIATKTPTILVPRLQANH